MGKLQFWLYMIGFNLTFFPMHFLGLEGMPRRIYTYAPDMNWNFWNFCATMGAYITAIGGALFFLNFIYSIKFGEKAPADPWDGRTLEWSIPSPPPEYNFAKLPEVSQLDDWWYKKYTHDGKRLNPPQQPVVDPKSIHLPNQSFWPIVLAFGITMIATGFVVSANGVFVSLIGVALTVAATYGWAYEEP
jgi:cytochrome c oxidase subunit 1